MKKTFLFIAALFLCCSLAAAEGEAGDSAKEYPVEFTYSMTVKSGKGSTGTDSVPLVAIEEKSDGTADITIPRFFFSEERCIESYVIKGASIKEGGDGSKGYSIKNYSVKSGDKDITVYSLDGTVDKDGNLLMTLVFKAGKMPFKVTAKYSSLK